MKAAPIFLCGMPRTATTWLGKLIDSHPDVAVFGESDYWSRSYLEPKIDGKYSLAQLAKLVAIQSGKDWTATTGDENESLTGFEAGEYGMLIADLVSEISSPITPAELYQKIFSKIAKSCESDVVIDKTPGHVIFIDRVRVALPGSSFILTKRAPLGFIASLTYRKEGKGMLDIEWIRQLAYHPLLMVLLWRRYARAFMTLHPELDSRILIIDYADIVKDPAAVIQNVCDFLCLNSAQVQFSSEPINSSFHQQSRRPPPAATSYWLKLLAGCELRAMYPEQRLVEPALASIILSWLLLPAVLLFVLYAPWPTKPLRYFSSMLGADLK